MASFVCNFQILENWKLSKNIFQIGKKNSNFWKINWKFSIFPQNWKKQMNETYLFQKMMPEMVSIFV